MDACKRIWFYSPAKYAAMLAGILAMFAALAALFIIC